MLTGSRDMLGTNGHANRHEQKRCLLMLTVAIFDLTVQIQLKFSCCLSHCSFFFFYVSKQEVDSGSTAYGFYYFLMIFKLIRGIQRVERLEMCDNKTMKEI